jgi:glycine dehydrogenase subunit 2
MLIFEHSSNGRKGAPQAPTEKASLDAIPDNLLRKQSAGLPEVSELQAVRHYTRLSRKNFSIDTEFYPLGSCTMKYNPRACNSLAMLPGFLNAHPLTPEQEIQGFLACMYDLQDMLCEATGMAGFSLAPMAGAQGEFAGVAMIEAYHRSRGDDGRKEILVPDAAHGTNPATAVMCGFTVKEIPTLDNGDVDIDALKQAVGPQTAGLMLTNPSTLGVFERNIEEIAQVVHQAGGLLYYDGANLNAILGKIRPGDMGFDVIHSNLHKTFSTPHGGGGPGSGAVGVAERLKPFLPLPVVERQENGAYRYMTAEDCPQSIGRLSAFMGNPGVLLRAFIYMSLLGREGMVRVAEFATLNANYMMTEAKRRGFTMAIDNRRASHEFIITLKNEAREHHVSAMDFAKRLLDLGYHAPTTYFPLLVPECLLIEPTETEAKEVLDGFMDALEQIKNEAETTPELLHASPQTLPVKRLDEVKAAKQLDLAYSK